MSEVSRFNSAEAVDEAVSAELPPLLPGDDDDTPTANIQRRLHEVVLDHMLHNDCTGERLGKCPCCDKKKKECRFRYRMKFAEETVIPEEQGTVKYRRPTAV
eukprot:6176422-Pleurochrysis_carterae.AAC.3